MEASRLGRIGLLLVACALGCDALPSEPVPLPGTWVGVGSVDERYVFWDDADGNLGGAWNAWVEGEQFEVPMQVVRFRYPEIEVQMRADAAGQCWPAWVQRSCTVRGAFVARNRIRLDGVEYERPTT